MTRRVGLAAMAFITVLMMSRVSTAGVLDVIWEMSGPRMIGVGVSCRLSFDGQYKDCTPVAARSGKPEEHKPWFVAEGTFYFSIPHNGFGWFDAFMVAAEPLVEFPWVSREWLVYSGVGASYDVLFGPGFSAFDNAGVKIRPIAVERNGWGVQYHVRVYPDEFGHDLFGRAPPATGNRPHETIQTASVTIPLRWW